MRGAKGMTGAWLTATLTLVLGPLACGEDGTLGATGGASGTDASGDAEGNAPVPLWLGAWYGAGADFPDGAYCLIFCANGRLFASDWPCTELDATDFDHYLMYEVSGQTFVAEGPEGVVLSGDFEISGESGTFRVEASEGEFVFALDRTATDSPLCTSDEPIWQGW
jgi:hypothetical protein